MIWDCEYLITSSIPTVLPYQFTAQILAIEINASNQKPTWYRAGYLGSFIDFDGEKFSGSKLELNFGKQLIQVPYLNYRLQFT